MYVAQGEPDATSNPALGSARRHLKFDLDEVERIHAEHSYDSRADSCECMVLQAKKSGSSDDNNNVPTINVRE